MKRSNRDIVFDKAEHIKNLIDQLEKELTDKDLTIEQKKFCLIFMMKPMILCVSSCNSI